MSTISSAVTSHPERSGAPVEGDQVRVDPLTLTKQSLDIYAKEHATVGSFEAKVSYMEVYFFEPANIVIM